MNIRINVTRKTMRKLKVLSEAYDKSLDAIIMELVCEEYEDHLANRRELNRAGEIYF